MFIHRDYSGCNRLRVVDKATGQRIEYVRWANTDTNEVGVLNRQWLKVGLVAEEVACPTEGFRIVFHEDGANVTIAESEPDSCTSMRDTVREIEASAGRETMDRREEEGGRVAWLGGEETLGMPEKGAKP